MPESRVEHSVDVYENRLLRTFHQQVDARLRAVVNHGGSANETETANGLLAELRRARRAASFLDGVSALTEPPSRLTMVLLKRAEYRAGLEGFLEFRRGALVLLDDAALNAPFESIPSLYETWGTLEVIDALSEVAPALGFTVTGEHLFSRKPNQVWIKILSARTALELTHSDTGAVLKLKPQRTYSPTSTTGLRSVSFQQIPDVAIELTHPGGGTTVILYDPKYKLDSEDHPESPAPTGSPKKQDIDAMHAYRDSVRDQGGSRVVSYAAILYPGATKTYGPGLAALGARPRARGRSGRRCESRSTRR